MSPRDAASRQEKLSGKKTNIDSSLADFARDSLDLHRKLVRFVSNRFTNSFYVVRVPMFCFNDM